MKMKLKKLRTVAIRILPAVILVFSLTLSLAAPAKAAGYDLDNYITSSNVGDGFVFSTYDLPVSSAEWYLYGFPSGDWISRGGNPSFFQVDNSQLSSDVGYTLECNLFPSGINLSGIKDGSRLSLRLDLECSLLPDRYQFAHFQLVYEFWSSDGHVLSMLENDIHGLDEIDIISLDDVSLDFPAGADRMTVRLMLFDFRVLNSSDGASVGFGIQECRMELSEYNSVFAVTLYDYTGQTKIGRYEDIDFPCTVEVLGNGFAIYNSGSSSPDYVYTHSGPSGFLGVSQIAYNRDVYWPVGSTFQLTQPDALYLMTDDQPTGYIEISNYSGSFAYMKIYEVSFPCTVHVEADGLYFYYAGSDELSYYFPFGSIKNVVGVSQALAASEVQYPVGSTFTLSWDSWLYIIRDGDLPELPTISIGSSGDPPTVDSGAVNDFFVDLMVRLDVPFADVLGLFWQSTLLHDLLLMAAVFAFFSFMLFGKKG